ncbi:MAG: winged helix-turn-helix domain-containing protein [Oceanihabitans sp.]
MNNRTTFLFKSFGLILLFVCAFSCKETANNNFSETVKVSLREVGHKLLLVDQDSTSLVHPVLSLGNNKYQITFENSLTIQPDSLVAIIKNSFEKADLPKHYITEVTRCNDQEVAYSYAMKKDVEKGIIPCGGRDLKNGCYLVTVHFTKITTQNKGASNFLYILGFSLLVFIAWIFYRRKQNAGQDTEVTDYRSLGMFKFYPEQNKLIKAATEISLSKKECEILALFVEQPNQIITREELTKKVWEDKGVIVGRSLDTYISKLRNKLKADASIQIVNVHGVGYKLQVG